MEKLINYIKKDRKQQTEGGCPIFWKRDAGEDN
jgi:hypothetical protein